jgi:hypothetical protein
MSLYLHESFDVVLKPTLCLLLHDESFKTVLLSASPSDNRGNRKEALLIRYCEDHGAGLPDSQRYLTGQTPAVQ